MRADKDFAWPEGKRGAVSLTYDDGLPVHYTLVAPLLESNNLRGTFYPPIFSDLRLNPGRWQELAAAGHELGNHTVFHPCRQANPDPYPWLEDRYDLASYTPAQFRAELEVANLVLHLLDGQTERTFGNTCCDTTVGGGALETPMEPILKEIFLAARGRLTDRIASSVDAIDLLDIGCIPIDGRSLADLKQLVHEVRESSSWAVLAIHGVGPEGHSLFLDEDVHAGFLAWLADQTSVWTGPVRMIAQYLKTHRT